MNEKMKVKLYYTAASVALPFLLHIMGAGDLFAVLIMGAFIVFRPKDWGDWAS